MIKTLCPLLLVLTTAHGMADRPKAGVYGFDSPPYAEEPFRVSAILTRGKTGNFGIEVNVIEIGYSKRVTFKGTLTTQGLVHGTVDLGRDEFGDTSTLPLSGSGNSTANKLDLRFRAYPGLPGQVVLSWIKPVPQRLKPPVSPRQPISRGIYILSKTEVGAQPEPYQDWTGETAATTLNERDTESGKIVATLKGTWEAPPSDLQPGQTYTLTGNATAKFAQGYHANVGMTVRWVLSGDVRDVQVHNAFAGYATSGQLSTDSNGQCVFTVGKGGSGNKVVIYMVGGGNISRNPCAYTYIWKAGN